MAGSEKGTTRDHQRILEAAKRKVRTEGPAENAPAVSNGGRPNQGSVADVITELVRRGDAQKASLEYQVRNLVHIAAFLMGKNKTRKIPQEKWQELWARGPEIHVEDVDGALVIRVEYPDSR